MLDLTKVQCADFTPCVNQDFEIATGRTTADYADFSDEAKFPEALRFQYPCYPRNPRLRF